MSGERRVRPGAVRGDRVHRRADRRRTSRPTRRTGLRWALVGRNRAKLEAVRRAPRRGQPEAPAPELLEADAADAAALGRVAAAARVVITTVGPYALYGEPLVAACAAAGTDYVDLTGEPEFVDRMCLEHHAEAERSGARIVHCCGFDSIPHDLGAYFTVKQLPEGVPLRVDGYVRSNASFSGGTYHSAINGFARGRQTLAAAQERRRAEPRPAGREVHSAPARIRRDARARRLDGAAADDRRRRSSAAPPPRSSATAPTSPTATTWSPVTWRRSARSPAGVGARRAAGAAAADPQAAAEDQIPGRGARARPSARAAGSASASSARAAASASSPRSPAATPATARPRRCSPSRRSASPSTSCRRAPARSRPRRRWVTHFSQGCRAAGHSLPGAGVRRMPDQGGKVQPEHLDVLIVGAGLSGHRRRPPPAAQLPGQDATRSSRRARTSAAPGTSSATPASARTPTCTRSATASGPGPRRSRSPTARRSCATCATTAREAGIDRQIRFNHRVISADWSSEEARWTVEAERDRDGGDGDADLRLPLHVQRLLPLRRGLHARVPGDRATSSGEVIHPQHWPEDARLRRQAGGRDRQRRDRGDAGPGDGRERRAGDDAAALADLRRLDARAKTAIANRAARASSRTAPPTRSCAGRTSPCRASATGSAARAAAS